MLQMLSRAAALEKQMGSQLERQQAEVPKFAAAVERARFLKQTIESTLSSADVFKGRPVRVTGEINTLLR